MREQRGKQLLVAVTQALRAVDHQHAGALGLFEQVRGVHELHVERRILAHQDHVEVIQAAVDLSFQFEPVLGVGEDFQWLHPGTCLAGVLVQIVLFHIEQRPTAILGGKEHGQRAVLFIGDVLDGVHDNP